MKRSALAVISLLFATAVFGSESRRWLVATTPDASGMRVTTNRAPGDVEPRNVARFELVNAFAADLTDAEAASLRNEAGVRFVEPVVERHAFDVDRVIGAQTMPYGISMMRAPLAWNARTAADVNVVVIDTGVDYRHPELAYVWAGGKDIVNNDDDPFDDNGHGTHVSGTIVAKNDKLGVVGIAPGMRLYSVKVLNAQGNGDNEDVIKALDWVVAKKKAEGGRWVINLSLGGSEGSEIEKEAFRKAADEGIIIVAASGNSSTSTTIAPVQYPAAFPGVVAVSAVNEAKLITNFSCQGPEIAFTAPGMAILSTVRVGTDEISYIVNGTTATQTFAVEGSKKGTLTAPFVYCGLGKEGDFPPSVVGKIALIKRGDITFAEKAKRAKLAGAAAVVIFNNDGSTGRWTMLSDTDPSSHDYPWPLTVSMKQSEGEALVAKGSGTLTVAYMFDDYGEKSGTSMASPHIAGAAAFLWSIAPNASAASILSAMTVTAIDLGPAGPDSTYGAGLVDLHAAARLLAPGAFSEPEPDPNRPTTGRRFLKH